jgi:hypothetical protein
MSNVTPIRPGSEPPSPPPRMSGHPYSIVRRGRLPGPHASIQLKVEAECSAADREWRSACLFVIVEFRGTPEALIAAGCATEPMLAGRGRGFAGRGRGFRRPGDHEAWSYTRRARTKAEPNRFRVVYSFADNEEDRGRPPREQALELPGVCALFPDGFPALAPAPDADDAGPTSAKEWRESLLGFCMSMTHAVVTTAQPGRWPADLGPAKPQRFHLREADVARIAALGERFEVELRKLFGRAQVQVIDEKRLRLRLVDDTRVLP